jgi:hypothetical protein
MASAPPSTWPSQRLAVGTFTPDLNAARGKQVPEIVVGEAGDF